MSKIFILGLPRTGTTSVCAWFLQRGFNTAHTAFTQRSFELADVIADAPVFCDYPELEKVFPESKFIYLERSMKLWLPSIQVFLAKAIDKLNTSARGFNPVLSRAYATTFDMQSGDTEKINSKHMAACWLRHQVSVESYFHHRQPQLLKLDVAHPEANERLCEFLNLPLLSASVIPKLNVKGRVIAWDKIKHPCKIPSNAAGPERRKYFDFAL